MCQLGRGGELLGKKVFRRGDLMNLLNSEYLICGTVDNSSRLSGEVLCSCDSNSLLAVDLVAAYIKHGIQQRNTPSTEVTMTEL